MRSLQVTPQQTRHVSAIAILMLHVAYGVVTAQAASSQRFCEDWRFQRGDVAGAEAVDFNDADWTQVRLPHDWAIAGPFNPRQDGFAGKLPWKGVSWYRKEFTLDQPPQTRVYFDFDGVMAFPRVYVNGQLAGDWDYGYTSFRIDATPYVNLHGKNLIAVRVDTTNHGTRWYPGAGIYRKVMLELREPVHIAQWGVFVRTPEVSADAATVQVEVQVANHTGGDATGKVDCAIVDPQQRKVADLSIAGPFLAGDSRRQLQLKIASPKLWDVDNPSLYTLQTDISIDGKVVDSDATAFGIRTIKFTPDDGFQLNGRRVQLHGVNLHHDQGPLGAAFYTRAMQRQLEIMQNMGVNSLRTSHNAPAPEVLDLCDRMGILVWDECFDKWNATADRVAGKPSHQEHARRHLRSLVCRDRNHPSVITWSIGNEIPDDAEGVTPERVKMMADVVRQYDASRPVTIGSCFPHHVDKDMHDALDIVGWNYQRRYANQREQDPRQPIVYSESASALSTRGFYSVPLPRFKTDYSREHQVDSYDLNAAPWADIPDVEFDLMKRDSFVAGEFVWTGFDYLGEPTPFSRWARSSYFGIVDLCGIPKDRYWLYRSYWNPQSATVHILPHWNWSGHEGDRVPVFVYTNGDSAELFLNGKSLGRRTKGVMPRKPENLAAGKPVEASSVQPGNYSEQMVDGEFNTRWCAAEGTPDQWVQVDLEEIKPLRCILIDFEREPSNYGYSIEVSDDAQTWETIASQRADRRNNWGSSGQCLYDVDAVGRYVRIVFNALLPGTWASIREFSVYSEPTDSCYYDPTYNYRLRWNDVRYESGTLKTVAYRDGNKIGSAEMRTAGEPAAIRLTSDRTELSASGDDLAYVLVECVDREDVLCPLSEDLISFHLEGPGVIAGVGNGNPLSLEPFQANERKLFYGKAMLIVRPEHDRPGTIRVTAEAEGLQTAVVELKSN